MSRTTPPLLFDSKPEPDCLIHKIVTQAETATESPKELAYVVENWRADPAVTPQRAQGLRSFADSAGADCDFIRLLRDYDRQHNLDKKEPRIAHFLEESNADNQSTEQFTSPLLHFASLTKLLKIATDENKNYDTAPLRSFIEDVLEITFSSLRGGQDTVDAKKVADALQNQSDETRREFGAYLLRTLPFSSRPWWVTLKREIDERVLDSGDWSSIIQQLGMGKETSKEIFIAWEYPVAMVERIYRPTAIDAGNYAFWHPTGPNARHGYTMPLDNGKRLPEFIHRIPRYDDFGKKGKLYLGIYDPHGYSIDIASSRITHQAQIRAIDAEHAQWVDRHW